MRLPVGTLIVALACVVAGTPTGHAQGRRAATPVDAIDAILDAFRSHQVVALGEGPHANEQGHAFRLRLVRDTRFASTVNDIVVESGSARHQVVMDRFVSGEQVPFTALRDVIEDTVTAMPTWDRAIYEEFFRAIRDVNAGLPRERHLRILLGDPPIEWTSVRSRYDYLKWLTQRDHHPADVIAREVIARDRRALVIYGDGHLQARHERPGRTITSILEGRGVRVFNITSTFADLAKYQPELASWRPPVLALLAGTALGTAPYELLFGPPPPIDYFRAHPSIADHYDAVLYLGRVPSMAPLSYPRCADPEYVKMRVARMMLTGAPATVADRLAGECVAAAR